MEPVEIKKKMLEMSNDALFQELTAYYAKNTVFDILKTQRNENRHSAFLCWLLNPDSDHGLSFAPLRKLLALYAFHNENCPICELLLSGNYDIHVEQEATTEKVLGQFGGINSSKRIDIWMVINVVDRDSNTTLVPIIIENKVYAKEGDGQTEAYHSYCKEYINQQKTSCAPVEIFLTPDESDKPDCNEFIHITYQDVLDYVLEPLSAMEMNDKSKYILSDYIINLGKPGNDTDGNTPKKLANSILAVPSLQRQKLRELYKKYSDLFKTALVEVSGDKSSKVIKILGLQSSNTQCSTILQDFWNNNIVLFNTILYVCRTDMAKDHENDLLDVFKQNRRDTSKYIVLYETSGNGTTWKKIPGYEKPMSKGKTVALFFTKWMQSNAYTIEEVRKAFPTDINTYYSRNKSKKEYDSLIWFTEDDTIARSESGFQLDMKTQSNWDLYPISSNLGYGNVFDSNRNRIVGKALIAKMWRKNDFDELLKHIQDNSQTYFKRIRIVQC